MFSFFPLWILPFCLCEAEKLFLFCLSSCVLPLVPSPPLPLFISDAVLPEAHKGSNWMEDKSRWLTVIKKHVEKAHWSHVTLVTLSLQLFNLRNLQAQKRLCIHIHFMLSCMAHICLHGMPWYCMVWLFNFFTILECKKRSLLTVVIVNPTTVHTVCRDTLMDLRCQGTYVR